MGSIGVPILIWVNKQSLPLRAQGTRKEGGKALFLKSISHKSSWSSVFEVAFFDFGQEVWGLERRGRGEERRRKGEAKSYLRRDAESQW